MSKKDKFWLSYRTFPHSNSKRKIANRCAEDEREARKYTDSFIGNRHNREEIPNVYDDKVPCCVAREYEPKANKRNQNYRNTLRKLEEDNEWIPLPEPYEVNANDNV